MFKICNSYLTKKDFMTKNKMNSKFVNKSEIARKLGITPAYVQMILSGARKAPVMRKRISELIKNELKAA